MQKKVIALAVAALASGVAMAQSNVTVYGVADAVATNFSTNNVGNGSVRNQRGFDDGAVGSRIGFKGNEDLGNGLSAVFTYELGIAPTNNVNQVGTTTAAGATLNNLSTRQAFVGLSDKTLGTLSMGRYNSLGWEFQAGSRPWGGLDPFRTSTNVHGMSINTSDRISNAVEYASPVILGGLSFKGQYSADARTNNADQNTNDQVYNGNGNTGRQPVYLLGAKYVNGPIDVMGVYRNQAAPTDLAGAPAAAQRGKYEWGLRGAYDFQVVKVGLSYQRQHLDAPIVVNGGNYQVGYMYGGFVTVPFGAKFLLSLEAAKSSGDQKQGAYGYMVNGQYLFSKRTSVYAQAGYMKMNQDNAAATNLGSYGSTGIEGGKRLTGFMAGVLHTF